MLIFSNLFLRLQISKMNISPEQLLSAPQLNIQDYSNTQVTSLCNKYIPGEGFTAKYDPENQYIAIGCNNGLKLLFSNKEKKIVSRTENQKETPVTSVKWRPMNNTKTKVLGVGDADGNFEYWHVPSMKKLFSIEEKENSIHCIDFSPSGEHFATAGRDAHIRIYDENTKSISTTFGHADWNYRGHSNRIFSIKFIDQNTIISGGWDSVIHLWDTRVGKSIKSFYGPHVAGDSIDYANNQLLIGCYAAKNQIQIWDYAKFQQKQTISWTSVEDKDKVAYVYSCCFSPKSNNTILAGACGINQVKVFNRSQQGESFKEGFRLHGLKNGVFSVDHSWKRNQICFSTAHQGFYVYQYKQK